MFIQPSSLAARALSWRPLKRLGRISYGVYLFHAPIAWLALHVITPETLARTRSVLMAGMASGTFVPAFSASGFLQLPAMMNPTVMRFAIVSAFVLIATSIVAGLHFRYVERRFLAMRPASANASGSGPVSHCHPSQACLPGIKP